MTAAAPDGGRAGSDPDRGSERATEKRENKEVVGHLRFARGQLHRQFDGAGGQFSVTNILAPGS